MKMAAKSRGRCSKRKAKDFIYEITENDLSADDDCEESPSKIYKISSDIQATSESSDQPNLRITETNSDQINKTSEGNSTNIVTSANKKVELSECPPEIVLVQEKEISVTDEMRIDEGSNVTHTCSTVKNAEKDSNCEMSIVEINDSDTDLSSSVQLIEKTIPLVELSDGETLDSVDATQAENTINESFVIIDEVGPTPIKEVDNPIITISFKNEDTKKCYESRILKFLQTFTEFEVFSNDLSVNCCKKLELCTDNVDHKTPKKKHRKKKTKKELFVLDTNPTSDDFNKGVRYSSKFTIEEEKRKEETTKKTAAPSQTCFNCGESHSLKDCKEPKDYNKINASRQKFMNSKNKVTRYHEEEDQKFSNLKPGVISEKLRNALGLRKNEYPSYIYGMRELGYPPGWMEDAKFVGSSLSMFNINGGKVKRDKGVKKKGLDPTKIIAYPGFNAPMQKGFSDDYRKYRVRPYSKIMDRNLMLKRFEDFPEAESNSDNSDMDLDDTMETESRTMGIQKVMKMETSSYNSPTLTELEKEKRKLIDALNASNTSSQINISLNESNNNGENDEAKYVNTTESIPLVAVKSSVLGTPILKSSSPYSRLPKPDNFTVGVSPVIDFENLPNSTGTYEQMSEVLSKVRNTLKNLESCKS